MRSGFFPLADKSYLYWQELIMFLSMDTGSLFSLLRRTSHHARGRDDLKIASLSHQHEASPELSEAKISHSCDDMHQFLGCRSQAYKTCIALANRRLPTFQYPLIPSRPTAIIRDCFELSQ